MAVVTKYIKLSTRGNTEVSDLTGQVRELLAESGLKNGIVCVSVIGSTGALTTCEYEPGLVKDIKEVFDKLIPAGDQDDPRRGSPDGRPAGSYHHDQTWHDGNGHSHLRASMIGPSLTIPMTDGELALGTWQQIIFIDFDNRPRKRQIICQFIGE